MWAAFFLDYLRFALHFATGLVIFAMAWLYFDAWSVRHERKEIFKFTGLVLLSLSYIVEATVMTTALTPLATSPFSRLLWLVVALRLPGYVIVLIGLLRDPLPQHPLASGQSQPSPRPLAVWWSTLPAPVLSGAALLYPILSALVALLYLRRATIGLERHLRPVAVGFFALSLALVSGLATLWSTTTNITIYKLVAPFGPLWIIEHIFLGIGLIILGRWVWQHLLRRFQSQLFLVFIALIFISFLATTLCFTALLLKRFESETLAQLTTDVRMLEFALTHKKAELLADAEILAQHGEVKGALAANQPDALLRVVQEFLVSKRMSSVMIVDQHGRVLVRGEDVSRRGDSLSDTALMRRALRGEAATSFIIREGAVAPTVSIRGIAPITVGPDPAIRGAVLVETIIDTAFVDGIKKATGLEASVYGGDILAATTLIAADTTSRWVGAPEVNASVIGRVLKGGEVFRGSITAFGTPYLAVYIPLQDADNNRIGMMSVSKPQVVVLQAAGRSIELTFLTMAGLILASLLPAYFMARYLSYQAR
jgi:hypothetical protein